MVVISFYCISISNCSLALFKRILKGCSVHAIIIFPYLTSTYFNLFFILYLFIRLLSWPKPTNHSQPNQTLKFSFYQTLGVIQHSLSVCLSSTGFFRVPFFFYYHFSVMVVLWLMTPHHFTILEKVVTSVSMRERWLCLCLSPTSGSQTETKFSQVLLFVNPIVSKRKCS